MNRCTSWLLIAVLTVVWAVPVGVRSATAQPAENERRVALAIGNGAYDALVESRTAVANSRAVADALEEIGFEVYEAENINRKDFEETIEAFAREAEGASAAVLYYAGHSFQRGGKNLLVPIDAKLSARDTIPAETLALDSIISRLREENRQTLVFVDGPFVNVVPDALKRAGDADGLAAVNALKGTFIAYAAQPGQNAIEGDGEYSPFTAAFLEHLASPGISISDMMQRIEASVAELTDQAQKPWDRSALRSQFYFSPEAEADAALTEEDRDLLLALDPELRKKFESRFGIKINEQAAAGQGEALVASIQPRFQISSATPEEDSAPAAPAPVVEQPAQPVGRLLIEQATEEVDTALASPSDAPVLDESGAIPLPSARPDGGSEQQIAALPAGEAPGDSAAPTPAEPARAADPALAADTEQASDPETPVAEDAIAAEPDAPAAASTDLAALQPDAAPAAPEQPVAPAGKERYEGPFVPAPVTTDVAPALKSTEESVVMAAVSGTEDRAGATAGSTVDTLGPIADGTDRLAGQDVSPASAAVDTASADTLAPVVSAPSSDARPADVAAAPVVGVETIAPAASANTAAEAVARTEVAVATPAEAIVAAAATEEELTSDDLPETDASKVVTITPMVVPGAPVLIPAEPAPIANAPETVAPSTEPAVQTAALSPEQMQPPAIGGTTPPADGVETPPQAVPLPSEEEQRETARQIQSELTRLGCYRSGIDGVWGANSARGLLRYFATKREDPDDLDPTPVLLLRLQGEAEVVCRRTEAAPVASAAREKPRQQRAAPAREQRQPVAARERPAKPAAAAQARPAKPAAAASSAGNGSQRKISRNLKLGGLR